MGSLVRLLVLTLVVAAVVARPKGPGRKCSRPTMAQQFMIMKKGKCLPDDFVKPDFSACECETNPLQCFASSTGISGGDSGYNQTAAEAFVDERSNETTWTARQKELLQVCQNMVPSGLATKNKGAFVLFCRGRLQMADCNKQRLVEKAIAVDPENGEEVAKVVATMAEGHCFKRHLNYSEDVTEKWLTCANENNLDLGVLVGAGIFYKKLAMGSNDLPDVAAVADQLERLDAAIKCYSLASGEVSADDEINYDVMVKTIDAAEGKSEIKAAAKAIVDRCRSQEPQTSEQFRRCYFEAQPYACAALQSYRVANKTMA